MSVGNCTVKSSTGDALPSTQGMSSVFFNKGENCIAAGRIFLEESIHDEFVARVVQECKKMVSCVQKCVEVGRQYLANNVKM